MGFERGPAAADFTDEIYRLALVEVDAVYFGDVDRGETVRVMNGDYYEESADTGRTGRNDLGNRWLRTGDELFVAGLSASDSELAPSFDPPSVTSLDFVMAFDQSSVFHLDAAPESVVDDPDRDYIAEVKALLGSDGDREAFDERIRDEVRLMEDGLVERPVDNALPIEGLRDFVGPVEQIVSYHRGATTYVLYAAETKVGFCFVVRSDGTSPSANEDDLPLCSVWEELTMMVERDGLYWSQEPFAGNVVFALVPSGTTGLTARVTSGQLALAILASEPVDPWTDADVALDLMIAEVPSDEQVRGVKVGEDVP